MLGKNPAAQKPEEKNEEFPRKHPATTDTNINHDDDMNVENRDEEDDDKEDDDDGSNPEVLLLLSADGDEMGDSHKATQDTIRPASPTPQVQPR